LAIVNMLFLLWFMHVQRYEQKLEQPNFSLLFLWAGVFAELFSLYYLHMASLKAHVYAFCVA